jgi:hypothetical protein
MKELPRPFLSFKLPLVTMEMIIMVYLERLRNEKKQKKIVLAFCFSNPPPTGTALNRRDDDV